ncbi:unnamed protein product [Rotaria sordida]|uniref:TPR-like protein n=1 Tax=Rotaria sordida TaxID=392033 RepID=A0A818Y2V8_9BILA|nr:unnamed protein product [Rotaria sordida]
MNDATSVLTGHTKKYHIPLNHLEHTYIQQCTDSIELERIYKELISGEVGSHKILEQLTLDRIRNIQSNNQISRQDQISNNKSNLSNNESQQTIVINSISNSSNVNDSNSTISEPIINNNFKQIVPASNEEWEKFNQQVSSEFHSDCEDNHDNELSRNESYEDNKRRHTAEQHRLNGDTAFKLNNYQQSIDLYTKSIILDNNSITYMKRAIAYFKIENFDASIQDCSQVLLINSKDIQALFHRASCYYAKEQYDEAKNDLNNILIIDPDNEEAQNLLNTVLTVQNKNSNSTAGDNDNIKTQLPTTTSLKTPSLDIEEEEEEQQQQVNNNMTHSMTIDIHSDLNSENISPSTFDHQNVNQFQLSSLNDDDGDDDDGMALGDEAGTDLTGNLSDEEGHIARSANVSPTNDNDSDTPESNVQRPVETTSVRQNMKNNLIDQSIAFGMYDDNNNKRNNISTAYRHQISDDYDDLYDKPTNHNLPTISKNSPSYKQNTSYSTSWTNYSDTNMRSTTVSEAISNSNFGSTIQSWLHDFITSQTSYRFSSFYDRPWSKSPTPWSLNKILGDIEKFNVSNEYKNAIEVSKKMLHNGLLDYHYHTECIVNILTICAQCYLKLHDYVHTIQYATEALQYNKNDADILICRAKAFENEKCFLFSYADYVRVPTNNFSYHLTRRACEKLEIELNSSEDKTWREKLLNDKNDDERYLTYLKMKNEYSENNSYEWYRTYADQLYLDACFVLAIRCYTFCIELQPNTTYAYLKRAACYLNVFEPQKAIDDCDIVLKEDKNNFRALYRKASAYRMSRDYRLHELTLKECIKLQPHNQIVLAEYYTCRHQQIPREKRRIRTNPITSKLINENNLSYDELEQIRLDKIYSNSSLNSNNINDQCSFILHLPEKNSLQSFDYATTKLIETIINISRIMIQAEQYYQQEHKSIILSFSYIKFCFHILVELTKLPQIDIALSMIDENYRTLLDDLLSYYSSISSMFNDIEQLNRLKKL